MVNLTFLILAVLAWVPVVRLVVGLVQIVVFVFWVMGIVYAVREQENEVPLLGCVKLLK